MIYTAEQVREMVVQGQLQLSNLAQRRLSKTQVIIEVDNRLKIDVLTLPECFKEDGLLDSLCHSFTLASYAFEVTTTEKKTRNSVVSNFIEFVHRKYGPESEHFTGKVPSYCFADWLEHLKQTATTYQVWQNLSYIRKILNRTLEKRYGKTNRWPTEQREAWLNLIKCTPNKPRHQKAPPLGQYLGIPHHKFTNKELYMGLRYGVIWLLQRLHRFRQLFLAQTTIADDLNQKFGYTESDLISSYQGIYRANFLSPKSNEEAKCGKVLLSTWNVIRTDPLLTEWQSYCWLQHRANLDSKNILISETEQELLLSRFVTKSNLINNNAKSYGKNDVLWRDFCKKHSSSSSQKSLRKRAITRPCFWGEDWLLHTGLENMLIVWLLASERAQKSGIEKLRLSDVSIEGATAQTLQISTIKLRRMQSLSTKNSILNVETPIYKQHEPPFQAYSNWLRQEQKAHDVLKNYNPKMKFVHRSSLYLAGVMIPNTSKSISIGNLPLQLLVTKGSTWNKTFISEATPNALREANAFIAIIQNRIEKKKSQLSGAAAIPISPIGQSLAVEQELANNQSNHLTVIESNVIGHSESTGRNIYKDGFAALGLEEIIEPVRDFARRLGDEKVKLAIELANRLQTSSKMLTIHELEAVCGIESSRSDQETLLATLDEQNKMIISGEIIKDDQMLVVQTDFTAAMMWGYICHLESSLNQIIQSERSTTTLRYLAQLIHLHHTYRRFDVELQTTGQALASELQFPFPPII
jgi:hypothetical protein